MSNASWLLKKDDCNTKITEIEKRMPRIIGLVTIAALNRKLQKSEKLKTKYQILLIDYKGYSEYKSSRS